MIGTLELNRTNPAHIGSAPLQDLSKANRLNADGNTLQPTEPQKTRGAFESYLFEAVEAMNSQQTDVSKLQEQLITDPDSVDIHDVTTAMAKAQMSLSLAQTVIDRLTGAWQEISTTR